MVYALLGLSVLIRMSAGVIARYEDGDMGSSCSIVRIEIEGKKAEARTGECSTHPPRIGTPVTVLYNPTEHRLMTLSEHRPEYLMAIIHELLAAFALYMGWPHKGMQTTRETRAPDAWRWAVTE